MNSATSGNAESSSKKPIAKKSLSFITRNCGIQAIVTALLFVIMVWLAVEAVSLSYRLSVHSKSFASIDRAILVCKEPVLPNVPLINTWRWWANAKLMENTRALRTTRRFAVILSITAALLALSIVAWALRLGTRRNKLQSHQSSRSSSYMKPRDVIPISAWLPLSLYNLVAQCTWLFSCRSALRVLIEALCASELVKKYYPTVCQINLDRLSSRMSLPWTILSILAGVILFEFFVWLPMNSRDSKAVFSNIGFVIAYGLPFNILTRFEFATWDGVLIWAPVAIFMAAATSAIHGKLIFPMNVKKVNALRDGKGFGSDQNAKVLALTAAQNYELSLLHTFSNIALAVTITFSIGIAAGMTDVLGKPVGFAAVRLYGAIYVLFLLGFAYFFILQSQPAALLTEALRRLLTNDNGPTEGELPPPKRSFR